MNCVNEDCENKGIIQCAKCKTHWFCSKGCESASSYWYKKSCIEPHKIAFNLMRTVYNDDFGTMSKELKASYGFEKCKTLQDKINLLGLYQGLIKILECDINDIDRAFNENKLPELIVTTFYHKTRPEYSGEYFKWYLKDLDRCRH